VSEYSCIKIYEEGKIEGRIASYLLNASNETGDVLNCDGVLNSEAVALAFNACLVHQHTRICCEPSKRKTYVSMLKKRYNVQILLISE
jgi:hypothetical protein